MKLKRSKFMEPTNKELYKAFIEMKENMGLLNENGNLVICSERTSRNDLILLIKDAVSLMMESDSWMSDQTKIIINYVHNFYVKSNN